MYIIHPEGEGHSVHVYNYNVITVMIVKRALYVMMRPVRDAAVRLP